MYNRLVKTAFTGVIAQAESEEEKEVVIYGLESIVSNLVTLLVLLSIGFISNNFYGTIIYLLCFFFIRILAGGYHANTYLTCLVSSIFMYISVVAINNFVTFKFNGVLIILAALSYFIILLISPVMNGKRSFSEAEVSKTKKNIKIVLSIELLVTVLLYLIDFELYKFAVYAIIMEGVLAMMGKIKYKKFNKTTFLKKVMNVSLGVALLTGWIPCLLTLHEPEMPKLLKDKFEEK